MGKGMGLAGQTAEEVFGGQVSLQPITPDFEDLISNLQDGNYPTWDIPFLIAQRLLDAIRRVEAKVDALEKLCEPASRIEIIRWKLGYEQGIRFVPKTCGNWRETSYLMSIYPVTTQIT
jgi:hypothetical protein